MSRCLFVLLASTDSVPTLTERPLDLHNVLSSDHDQPSGAADVEGTLIACESRTCASQSSTGQCRRWRAARACRVRCLPMEDLGGQWPPGTPSADDPERGRPLEPGSNSTRTRLGPDSNLESNRLEPTPPVPHACPTPRTATRTDGLPSLLVAEDPIWGRPQLIFEHGPDSNPERDSNRRARIEPAQLVWASAQLVWASPAPGRGVWAFSVRVDRSGLCSSGRFEACPPACYVLAGGPKARDRPLSGRILSVCVLCRVGLYSRAAAVMR